MMRGLLALLVLCTFTFTQVELYVVTVDNFGTTASNSPIIIKAMNMTDYDDKFKYNDVYTYSVTFNISNEGDEDLPLEYIYKDDNDDIVDIAQTSLCNADFSTADGTVAAIVAMALGIMSDPVCPLQMSTMLQQSVFEVQQGNFSSLPGSTDKNDILSVKLEIYSSTYMSMKLSITDNEFWFDEGVEDPDENNPDGESQDGDKDSSNDQSADEDPQQDEE